MSCCDVRHEAGKQRVRRVTFSVLEQVFCDEVLRIRKSEKCSIVSIILHKEQLVSKINPLRLGGDVALPMLSSLRHDANRARKCRTFAKGFSQGVGGDTRMRGGIMLLSLRRGTESERPVEWYVLWSRQRTGSSYFSVGWWDTPCTQMYMHKHWKSALLVSPL